MHKKPWIYEVRHGENIITFEDYRKVKSGNQFSATYEAHKTCLPSGGMPVLNFKFEGGGIGVSTDYARRGAMRLP